MKGEFIMPVLHRLASSMGTRSETPNQKLARVRKLAKIWENER